MTFGFEKSLEMFPTAAMTNAEFRNLLLLGINVTPPWLIDVLREHIRESIVRTLLPGKQELNADRQKAQRQEEEKKHTECLTGFFLLFQSLGGKES